MAEKMSSFWSAVRPKKSTKDGETDIGKPPSGRSSKKSHSESTTVDKVDENTDPNADAQMDVTTSESEDRSLKRTSRMSRFKEQIFGRRSKSRDSSEKSKRSCSPKPTTGKRFHSPFAYFRSKKSDPVDEKEPPIPDSPKPVVKRFKKRAASASPSRHDGESKKVFRGLSREHLISPLPDPLKNFLFNRRSKSETRDHTPMKPSRRPGPLGRSWVKVYTDIAYMDDQSSIDIYPIPGYTGKPTIVPEAVPLPKAPTPPPPAIKNERIEQNDQDNKVTEEIVEQKIESTFTETSPGEENRAHTIDDDSPKGTKRRSRSRENPRFKGKKPKRPPTPVAKEDDSKMTEIPLKEDSVETKLDKHEQIETENYVENAGNNTESFTQPVECISTTKHLVYICDPNNEEISNEDPSLVDQLGLESLLPVKITGKKTKTLVARPREGKESEPITLETTKVVTAFIVKNKISAPETIASFSHNPPQKILIESVPSKPKRKPRLYENVEDFLESSCKASEEPPQACAVFENVLLEKEKNANEQKASEVLQLARETSLEDTKESITTSIDIVNTVSSETNELIQNDIPKVPPEKKEHTSVEPEIVSPIPDSPEYATVLKDRTSSEIIEKESIPSFNNNIPPPIPPKKKSLQVMESQSELEAPPPRPPRHLKPRTRSLDPSPCRKKKREITLLNETEPSRPSRGTKIYSGFIVKGSTPMTQTPQINRRRINHRDRPLPAPPRKKKSQEARKPQPPAEPISNEDQIQIEASASAVEPDETNTPYVEKRKKRGRTSNSLPLMHEPHNDQPTTSVILSNTDSPVPCPSTTDHSHSQKSELDHEIDANLRNIEDSFTTLDTVLSCLKKYSAEFPLNFLENSGRRRSCDVFYNSSSRLSSEYDTRTPDEMSQSLDEESPQFSSLQLEDFLRKYPLPIERNSKIQQAELFRPELRDIRSPSSTSDDVAPNYSSTFSAENSHEYNDRNMEQQKSSIPYDYDRSPSTSPVPSRDFRIKPDNSSCEAYSKFGFCSNVDQQFIPQDSLSDEHSGEVSNMQYQSDRGLSSFSDLPEGPPTPASSPVDFSTTTEEHSQNHHNRYTLPKDILTPNIQENEEIIIATPIRSKVILGIVPKSGEQITTETHRLKTGYSTDSKQSVDEPEAELLDYQRTSNQNSDIEEEDVEEETIIVMGNDTVSFMESEEEEEILEHNNIFVLGPIAAPIEKDEKIRDTEIISSQQQGNNLMPRILPVSGAIDLAIASKQHQSTEIPHMNDIQEQIVEQVREEVFNPTNQIENDFSKPPGVPENVIVSDQIASKRTQNGSPERYIVEESENLPGDFTMHNVDKSRELEKLPANISVDQTAISENQTEGLKKLVNTNIIHSTNEGGQFSEDTNVDKNINEDNLAPDKPAGSFLDCSLFSRAQLQVESSHDLQENVAAVDKCVSQNASETLQNDEVQIQQMCDGMVSRVIKEVVDDAGVTREHMKKDIGLQRDNTPEILNGSHESASNDIVKSSDSNLSQAEFLQKLLKDMSLELDEQDETSEISEVSDNTKQLLSQEDLLEGVAAITGQLEGITYQIKDVLRGYDPSSSDESPVSSEYASTNTSNRSSIDVDNLDSESSTTYYSMSQPSMSNYSLLSYHTAASPSSPSPDLSDSRGSTPTLQESTVEQDDEEDTIAPENDLEHSDSQSSE